MKIAFWRDWGIRDRLITIAVVPATMMFIVISLALYFSGRDEIRSEINERGNLLVSALAESSQYAVVSDNISPLMESLRGLLATDSSIISIQVLDAARKPLVSVGESHNKLSDIQLFEKPIRAQIPDIDVFDRSSGGPQVSTSGARSAAFKDADAVGYVQVVMSALPVLEAKRKRAYIGLAFVLLACVLSAIAGLVLARRLRDPLASAMHALRGIREGNYDVRVNVDQSGELGELQSAIVTMAQSLKEARQELEQRVAQRTSELQSAIETGQRSDAERRRLIAKGNMLAEEERRRISIEIHDHLNASLLFVKLEAQQLARVAAQLEDTPETAVIKSTALRIAATTADAYDAARTITKQLRPEQLDTLGLKGAIDEMLRNYRLAHPTCMFDFRAQPSVPKLSTELTITAYRVIQEALSNVVKHANASHATVTLWVKLSQDGVCISIEDDGVGFDMNNPTASGIGLIGMRERVAAVGGWLKITSAPGAGTNVTIEMPLKRERDA